MTQSHETTIQVYTFIQGYVDENGFAPSQREMAKGCYLSHSGVTRHLDRLEAWGCIHRKSGQARGISLTGKAPPTGSSKK
jgi:SOS-response transcriptional repressor LexA